MNLFDAMRSAANGERAVRDDQWIHTRETRLAILCGASQPTPAQIEIAEAEADDEQRILTSQ